MIRLAVACLVLLAGCSTSTPIIVATEAAFPPFNMLDESGRPVGFEIDLVTEIAAITGDEIKFLIQPEFARLFDEIDLGRADLIASTVSITDERRAAYVYSSAYYETGIGVLVRRSGPVEDLGDLAGRRVGASAGTTSVDAAQALGTSDIIEYRFSNEAVDAMRDRTIDAYLVDLVEAEALEDDDIVVLDEPAAIESYALLAPKGNKELIKRFDAALMELARTGRLTRLRAEHGLP